ncbi:hypothetical protein CPC16_009928 [Podila verticillata]|nr:hypothetical protein BGZ52_000862 [Haplosporangium bisporale]KAF9213459.1 hypothetical protein BGZ59_005328 [Podila verticillata]KAF9394867.1 hypothetical protein CPC16_009928 [Podila verticillata]KAI9232711.1 MAG: hypothetical protein BYD32DRAFT_153714 [Podila humilis]KFH70365.1 hypothetical protein MVEG_03216 [Podila verticillata NRRL 6337]
MSNKPTSAGVKQRPSPYPRPTNPGQLKKPPITVVASRLNKQPASLGISTPPPVEHVPVNDLVQAARKAFSDRDFVSALQLLTGALNVAPKDINLLDSRAACCEKLGRFNDALTDAKTMIQLYPQSPKAYLRAGKILRQQQNYKSCTRIYVAGAERCEKVGKEYETLARLAKDMTATMEGLAKKEARILDPVERLPYELIVMVFDSLTFAQRLSCMGVCKKWSSYLGSIKRFWLTIDLTKPAPSPVAYQKYLPLVVKAETNNRITNKTVLSLIKYTPPKRLRLGCAPQVTGALFSQLIRMKRAAALEQLSLRMNAKIYDQELSLFWSATPNLRCLDLHDSAGVSDAAVISLLARCPLLEELDISECRITEACLMIQSPGQGPLVHLKKLVFGRSLSAFAREGVEALVAKFPNLETLDIRTLHPRGIQALESLGQLNKLKHLYTEAIDTPSDDSTALVVAKWVEGIPDLESLQLTYCKGVSDEVMRMIVLGHEPQHPHATRRGWSHSLKMLNLSYSTYLTNEGLLLMATNPMPQLHSVILNCCGWLDESGLCQMLAGSGAELCLFECARNGTISNNLMEQLATSCPKIEVVNVSSSQVTGLGVMALVNKRGTELRYLNLDGCQNVSADAIERARAVVGDGSRVSFLFPRSYR